MTDTNNPATNTEETTNNKETTETTTNADGSTTTTVTNTEGTLIKTTTNTDGSKEIITTKTDGSEYKTEISADGNTTTTTEVKPPTATSTSTTNTNTQEKNKETVEDTRTAVEKIKGTKTYAPNDIIGKNCNIEIDGFQFVAEEISLSESYARRNLVRTNILGGGQITSKGEYVPRSFSFNTNLNYPEGKPDEYDKLWAYMNNKVCKIVCQYTGDMDGEVQIQKTYPKGMGNTVKLSITVTEVSKADNTYTVKTDMGNFTTITNNTQDNIKQMEDEDGNTVTVQTNISDKHTTDMSKNLKEIKKDDKKEEIVVDDISKKVQADSTNTKVTNNTKESKADISDTTVNTNNTNDYVSKDVTINI